MVSCLVYDKGFYRSASDLYRAGFVYLEREDLIDSLIGYSDYEMLTDYGWEEEQDDDGDEFIVFRVD